MVVVQTWTDCSTTMLIPVKKHDYHYKTFIVHHTGVGGVSGFGGEYFFRVSTSLSELLGKFGPQLLSNGCVALSLLYLYGI